MTDEIFNESVFGVGSVDRIYVQGQDEPYLGERTVSVMLDVGDEALSIQLDGYHLAELRKTLQRAERWLGYSPRGRTTR